MNPPSLSFMKLYSVEFPIVPLEAGMFIFSNQTLLHTAITATLSKL